MTDQGLAPARVELTGTLLIADLVELEAAVNLKVREALGLPETADAHPVYTVVPAHDVPVMVHVALYPNLNRYVVSIRATVANELAPTPELFEAVARAADGFAFVHPFVEVTHDGVNVRVGARLFETFDPVALRVALGAAADAVVSMRRHLGLPNPAVRQRPPEALPEPEPELEPAPQSEPEPALAGGYL